MEIGGRVGGDGHHGLTGGGGGCLGIRDHRGDRVAVRGRRGSAGGAGGARRGGDGLGGWVLGNRGGRNGGCGGSAVRGIGVGGEGGPGRLACERAGGSGASVAGRGLLRRVAWGVLGHGSGGLQGGDARVMVGGEGIGVGLLGGGGAERGGVLGGPRPRPAGTRP